MAFWSLSVVSEQDRKDFRHLCTKESPCSKDQQVPIFPLNLVASAQAQVSVNSEVCFEREGYGSRSVLVTVAGPDYRDLSDQAVACAIGQTHPCLEEGSLGMFLAYFISHPLCIRSPAIKFDGSKANHPVSSLGLNGANRACGHIKTSNSLAHFPKRGTFLLAESDSELWATFQDVNSSRSARFERQTAGAPSISQRKTSSHWSSSHWSSPFHWSQICCK